MPGLSVNEELENYFLNNPNTTTLDWSFKEMDDQNIEHLVHFLKNIETLYLNGNKIGCNGARALAQIPQKLNHLDLRGNNIGFEGIKALVESPTLQKAFIDLSTDRINSKDVEALAQSQYSRCQTLQVGKPERNFAINDICDKLYDQLIEAYFKNQSINLDEDSVKKIIFDVRTIDNNGILVKHILEQPDKYPFLINLQKDEEGYGLSHFYHSPEMQEFLFKHGLVPEKEQEEQDNALQNVANGNQSTHDKVAVNQTNFITNKLVEDVKANKDELKQAATSYMENISKLLKQYQDNQMKVRLLSLTENEKRSVMENTLSEDGGVPDDKEFIEAVSNKVKKVLEQEYLGKNQEGEYIKEMSRTPLQYDYTRDEAKVTIPESIGYIKLLINRFSIPLKERKELLVTLANQNPELVQQKLPEIKLELGNNNVSQEQMTDRAKFYELLNNVADKKVNKLFEEISGLNIEETWREQKEFVLLKQIYMAATTYGENSNACTQGTWSQIINSVSEINLEMINQYTQHLEREREKDQERQRDGITEGNVQKFIENLAGKLIQYAKDNPEFRKNLVDDFMMSGVHYGEPEKIGLEQQKVLAKINQEFTASIKEFLHNYDRSIPKMDEYIIIINELCKFQAMQDFVQGKSVDNDQVTEQSNKTTSIQIEEESIGTQPNGSDSPPPPTPPSLPLMSDDECSETSSIDSNCTFIENNVSSNEDRTDNEFVNAISDSVSNIQSDDVEVSSAATNDQSTSIISPAPRNAGSKGPFIAASALAIAGVALGVAIAVYLEMLAVGIAVGACCLVAATIMCCCRPKSSIENNKVEKVSVLKENTKITDLSS